MQIRIEYTFHLTNKCIKCKVLMGPRNSSTRMNRMDTKVYVRLVVWNVTRSTKYFENIVRKHILIENLLIRE